MGKDRPSSAWLEVLAVAAILLLAAVLRMGWPGITEFKADEARLLSLALEMRQGAFAVRGISSSTGFPNFPMSVWLYAIPTFVWPHAYSATLFTGLLNTLAVAGCYWMVRRYWSVSAALAATLMLAVSPWAIIFSRKIWAQNLLPLFVMIWGISAALAFVEKKRWFLVIHIVCLAVAIQIHLAAVALAPATLLFIIVFHRRVDWRMVGVGVGLSLLLAAPFLYYLVSHVDAGTALPTGSGGEAGSGFSTHALRYVSMLTLGNDIHSLAGPAQFENYLAQLPPMQPVYALWAVLVLGGIVWMVSGIIRRREAVQSQVGFILLAWLFVPVLVFLWEWTPVYLHYFIATLPAQYMLAGVFFAGLLDRFGGWVRGIAWAALLASAAFQVYASLTLLSLVGTVATPGGFGTPLAVKLAAADLAREEIAAGAAEVLVAGVGSSPAWIHFRPSLMRCCMTFHAAS
ncbi:MAG: glycosyltransferase family 39 protein [Chloroflexota bacterium]